MNVLNVHRRDLAVSADEAAILIDSLSSPNDRLWPSRTWPAMRFDGPLRRGAEGGHGPIRYRVLEYEKGRRATFGFTAPTGFNGTHAFTLTPLPSSSGCRLEHRIAMSTSGRATLSWWLVFRPLHDALIEEALDQASQAFGKAVLVPHRRSKWVRLLRFLLGRRRPA